MSQFTITMIFILMSAHQRRKGLVGYGVEDESHENRMQAIIAEINRDGHGHERGRGEDVGSGGPFDLIV